MTSAEFETLFDEYVAEPLVAAGFRSQRGVLTLRSDSALIGLIRSSPRLARQGFAGFHLCLRHDFLRDRDGLDCPGFPRDPNDHPVRLTLGELERSTPTNWQYQGGAPVSRLGYRDVDEAELRRSLVELANTLVAAAPRWLTELSPPRVLAALRSGGQLGVAEQIWCEDYEAYLAGLEEHSDAMEPTTASRNPNGRVIGDPDRFRRPGS